ncbi:hypothetical protein [Natronospora cellulosivora (SeqCode)]
MIKNIYINALLENKEIIKQSSAGTIEWTFSQNNKNLHGLKQDDYYIYTTGSTGFGAEINYIYKINKESGQIVKNIEKYTKGNIFIIINL